MPPRKAVGVQRQARPLVSGSDQWDGLGSFNARHVVTVATLSGWTQASLELATRCSGWLQRSTLALPQREVG